MLSEPHGCYDRPDYKPSSLMQDGWVMVDCTRYPILVDVPFRMETACQYTHTDLGRQDERCDGCKWRVQ